MSIFFLNIIQTQIILNTFKRFLNITTTAKLQLEVMNFTLFLHFKTTVSSR